MHLETEVAQFCLKNDKQKIETEGWVDSPYKYR